MTISLAGSAQSRPTPQFKLQFNGSVIPGYCQNLDDPIRYRIGTYSVPGRDGDINSYQGAQSRTVTASMRILTRLAHVDGRTHLDDCLAQYRDALAILTRVTSASSLYNGDTDRYLPDAYFESASLPLAAPDHRAVTFTLTFRTASWYLSTTTRSATRQSISTARITGTASGSTSFAPAYFAGTSGLLSNVDPEFASLPALHNLGVDEGSLAIRAIPHFASSNNVTPHLFARVLGPTHFWELRWNEVSQRFEVSGNNTTVSDPASYAIAPAVTFSSGSNVLLCMTWDSTGTKLYVGVSGSAVVSSGTSTLAFGEIGTPSTLFIGGGPSAPSGIVSGYSNSVLSDLVTFSSPLTEGHVVTMFSGTAPYDPFDTDFPTTMLLDHPFNSSLVANSSSNSLYLDLPDHRASPAVITLLGSSVITMSGSDTGKVLAYSGSASPAVVVDCGTLTAVDSAGSNKIASVTGVNFGIAFEGDQRIGLLTTDVDGSFDATLAVTPLHER